ncbi:MAG: hypothetical protein M3250_08845 [Thermoproteota archaeon]|jgi:hypothetical protein|nr:hypothetical protein [Thermoproteota archaeon]
MNKNNQSNKITISVSVMYALLVVSSLFVIGNGILASNAAAQNMTGENATGTEFMESTVNTTNATSSPQASMGTSGVTQLTQGNTTTGNSSSTTP